MTDNIPKEITVRLTREEIYQDVLRNELKNSIIKEYGNEMFKAAGEGLSKWVKAADEGKVGRGRLIGKKY